MKKIIIGKNESGCRIDKFLVKEFFSPRKTTLRGKFTRGEIIRQIKNGNVLVNGKKVKPSYILKENDIIESKIKEQGTKNKIIPNKDIEINIIYQDENIIAVNKPAGLQIHPDHHEKTETLANALVSKFPEIKNIGEDPMRPGIVHRLDKDTSGAMVVARSQEAYFELKAKFKERKVEKKYWAVVFGRISESGGSGIIDKPIARSSDYRKQVISGKKTKTKTREAVTYYQILKESDSFSLVEVVPKTGRMHQIRVHLKSIGHPIAGDKIYGPKGKEGAIEASRQLLHARSIKFELFGREYSFQADLPDDFQNIIRKTFHS